MKSPVLRPIAWMFMFAMICFMAVSVVLGYMIDIPNEYLVIVFIVLVIPYFIAALILGVILVYNMLSLLTSMRTDVD